MQLQDQTREISVLRRSLGFGDSQPGDLMKQSCSSSHVTNDDLKPLLLERDSLKSKVKDLESELKQFKPDVKKDTGIQIEEVKTPENIP